MTENTCDVFGKTTQCAKMDRMNRVNAMNGDESDRNDEERTIECRSEERKARISKGS